MVVRPEPGASETADRLSGEGFDPVKLPLTAIRRLAAIPLPNPSLYDAVAITSGNAVKCAPAELVTALGGRPVYAVGQRTAEAVEAAGLSVAHAGTGGGEELAALVASEIGRGARVLFLCGRVRSRDFERGLSHRGIVVDALETYDSEIVSYTTDYLAASMEWKPLWGVMLHSALGARALAQVTTQKQFCFLFDNARFFCISDRVASSLDARSTARIRVSEAPSESGMMALLSSEA